MRTLTAGMTTFLNDPIDVEPVIIVDIDWEGTGTTYEYADKDVAAVSGKILVLSGLESLLSSKSGSSQSLDLTLDDTDGSIKTLLDAHDPYGNTCSIYQYFDDSSLAITDKILMYKGRINFDVAWNEGERTVSLSVLTKVEEREVGFSPEEGQFDFVSESQVGKPWPLCFGSPLHVPTTLIKSANIATLNDQICFVDPLLIWKRIIIYKAILANFSMHKYYQDVALSTQLVQGYTAQSLLAALLNKLLERKNLVNTYNAILVQIILEKNKIWNARRGRLAGAQLSALRANLATFRSNKKDLEDGQIGPIHGDIELLENLIPRLEASVEQRSNSLDKQYEAINQLSKLFVEYQEVEQEICRQQTCVTNTVIVKDADQFPQNVDVDVFINNLRFRGQFNNGVFDFGGRALPKYQNITLAARQTLSDPCSPEEHKSVFWVSDASTQLKGLYIYFISGADGKPHIGKVIEQEGTKCKLELVPWSRNTQSDEINAQVNWSSPSVSVGQQIVDGDVGSVIKDASSLYPIGASTQFTTGVMDQFVVGVTKPTFMTSLGFLPFDVSNFLTGNNIGLNQRSFELILRLSKIRERDNQLYIVNIGPAGLVPEKAFTFIAQHITTIIEAAPLILPGWLDDNILVDELPNTVTWQAKQGSQIISADGSCQVRVANILASPTIHSVSAFRSVDGGTRSLSTVPTRYYTIQDETLTPLTITTVRTEVPLSSLDEGWEDEIFVSLTSSIGPNVSDIIKHLVETYTDKSVDATSFAAVKTQIANYPAHFALLDRKNVFEQINEIALQARCVVYVINDVYFIKYLSLKPASVKTITQADVIQGTLNVTYTDLTDIMTRLIALWNRDYSGEDEPNKVTLRHNITKYGLHENEQNYYIYNLEELVEKSATFWLIRNSKSWKRIQFELNLDNIDLETFDAVTVDLPHVSTGTVLGLVENTEYNTENNTINMSIWLPILTGEMVEHTFAWPGSADGTDEFPFADDDTGSGNAVITGTLPSC